MLPLLGEADLADIMVACVGGRLQGTKVPSGAKGASVVITLSSSARLEDHGVDKPISFTQK